MQLTKEGGLTIDWDLCWIGWASEGADFRNVDDVH